MTRIEIPERIKHLDVDELDLIDACPANLSVLLEGNPKFRLSVQHLSDDGTIQAGVWEATPGKTRSVKGKSTEFCYILSGVVELHQEGCAPRIFSSGDAFVMKPGFVGTWRTLETVRKFFVIVG